MRNKGMTKKGNTKNILDLDEPQNFLAKTGECIDLVQMQRPLKGEDPLLKIVSPKYIHRDRRTRKIETAERVKTLRLIYDKRLPLADYRTLSFGTEVVWMC